MTFDANLKQVSSISAVFPAYNDAGTIPSMVLTALVALRQVTDDYEVIVTNDGSSDNTIPNTRVTAARCAAALARAARNGSFTPMATPNTTRWSWSG